MNMLESLASSAVRAAGKVQADLIIVYTATGALRMVNRRAHGSLCLTSSAVRLAGQVQVYTARSTSVLGGLS
jgi:pyruvate kinase